MSLSMNIASVQDFRIEYPPVESQEFLSLEEYIKITQSVIKSYCRQNNKKFSYKLLTSEDAISSIANQLMMADWRWKPEYIRKVHDSEGNVIGMEKLEISRKNYRHKCAIWAIKTYVKQSQNKKNKKFLSLDIERSGDSSLYDIIEDRTSHYGSYDNYDDSVNQKVKFLLNNSHLSNAQRSSVELYYMEGLTFEEAGVKLGISKQGVQQNVENALNNMRLTAGLSQKEK